MRVGTPVYDDRAPRSAIEVQMRRNTFRRAPTGEDGATLVIITLSLVAMFGMMVLVVDVGSVLFARRAMVNAADAAALAAAQSCGLKEGMGQANLQAEFYTVANQSGAELVTGYPQYVPSCDSPSGTVRVRVTTQRPLFFAPVLGLGEDASVVTQATASWGGAGAGEKVAPLMLSANRLSNCDIPPLVSVPPEGIDCAFWWNNSPRSQPEDLANAEWGTLDLLNWDVPVPTHCNNSTPPQFQEWMLNGFFQPLPIDGDFYGGTPGDGRTYVCRGQGNFGNALNNIIDDAIEVGDPLYFPVNDPLTQVDSSGSACPPPPPGESTDCSVDKYNIIGFAKLTIIALYKGNSPEAAVWCSEIPEADRDANARCMVAHWEEYTPEGLDPQGGENFGLVPVRLVE
jgi:Flp pilus assembly protein TadG